MSENGNQHHNLWRVSPEEVRGEQDHSAVADRAVEFFCAVPSSIRRTLLEVGESLPAGDSPGPE